MIFSNLLNIKLLNKINNLLLNQLHQNYYYYYIISEIIMYLLVLYMLYIIYTLNLVRQSVKVYKILLNRTSLFLLIQKSILTKLFPFFGFRNH